ncbi:MAG TPA: SDR family NAD(P)-dependent oxidoreductase [Polyangiaceae bacterium]|nr:SDR family NAD(P)-dependent oxidoreductase [Polyangiaceae bacterium]
MANDAPRELSGKVALVTGAGSGIGKAAAIALARQGARIGLLGRTAPELEETGREIGRLGSDARVLLADVSRPAEIEAAVEELAQQYDGLHIVFANAGVNGVWAPIEELAVEEWNQTIAINLSGTFFTIKYAVPYLKRAGGSIIVCASVNGTRMFSNTGATAYASSKAAQVAMTKMLAVELGATKIRVNVICPGAIDTEISENTEVRHTDRVKVPVKYPEGSIPLTHKKPGSAEQVAELVLFLASDRSSHISGTEVWIDGAQSLVEG